jgi:hypothetical protein
MKKFMNKAFVRQASCATLIIGVLAFWGGMLMAARMYPSEYDWRYMPISNLLSFSRNPAGYIWGAAGIVLCSICGLLWTLLLAQRWRHEREGIRLHGIRILQFGFICLMSAPLLSHWLIQIQKGHEIVAVLAFTGLLIGIVRLMFQTVERTLLRRMHRFKDNARMYAAIVASVAVFPVLFAGMIQVYVHYVLPELPWVGLSWRTRGIPVYLSFAFWEWITCAMLSSYMAIASLALNTVYLQDNS